MAFSLIGDVLHAPGIGTPTVMRATPWRRTRLSDPQYLLGWRVYAYCSETLIFHPGAVAGYRNMIGFFPKYHACVVTLWNASGTMPSGLMPMVLDELPGLPHLDWTGVKSDAPAVAKPSRKKPRRNKHRFGRAEIATSPVNARR